MKVQTEEFTDKNNKNLGSMDNQVEGLTDRLETLFSFLENIEYRRYFDKPKGHALILYRILNILKNLIENTNLCIW